MTDFTRVPLDSLLPHSPPMVLIDEILRHGDSGLCAAVTIRADSLFFDAGVQGVPAWVGIEYMAQAISAWAGIKARQENRAIRLGFLLGTRRLLMPRKVLDLGGRYEVEVIELFRDDSGLSNFSCRITREEELYVEARVNVFECDDIYDVIALKKEESK